MTFSKIWLTSILLLLLLFFFDFFFNQIIKKSQQKKQIIREMTEQQKTKKLWFFNTGFVLDFSLEIQIKIVFLFFFIFVSLKHIILFKFLFFFVFLILFNYTEQIRPMRNSLIYYFNLCKIFLFSILFMQVYAIYQCHHNFRRRRRSIQKQRICM